MNVFQWLSEYLLIIAAIYQLMLIIVVAIFAMRIGHVKTLDELLPEEESNEA